MKKPFLALVAAAAVVLGAAGQAQASVIGTYTVDSTNCASVQTNGICYGLKYTVTFTNADDMNTATFTASLLIQDDPLVASYDFAGAGISYISAVDVKGATGIGTVSNSTLTSAPNGSGNWTTSENKVNNDGCDANGNGFICSEDVAPVSLAPINIFLGMTPGSYTWAWTFNSPTGPLLGHIGVKFDIGNGTLSGQILSASLPGDGGGDGETVPEPGLMFLLGTALVLGGARLRKRS